MDRHIAFYTRKVAELGAVHPVRRTKKWDKRAERLKQYKTEMHRRIATERIGGQMTAKSYFPGIMNVCCGHGMTNEAYVQFWDKFDIRGRDALKIMSVLNHYAK